MDKEKMLERYSSRDATLFREELGNDAQYHALVRKKLAAEDALHQAVSDEGWKRYLELDSICNELESIRYRTMYLAGAADHEQIFDKS